MILIPDMKVTRIQMTNIVSKNSCPQKASAGERRNSIPSYFSRIASSNQTYNSHIDYSIIFVPVLLLPLPENQIPSIYYCYIKRRILANFQICISVPLISPQQKVNEKHFFLCDCNWTRTLNHLVLKRTLNHLARLTK